MKKSKLTIFICLAVFNVLLEVISSESSANSVTSQKFLKVKKFLKKMKDYKKTRFLISVAILLLSTSYNNHYLLNDPKLKPITFDFIEEDDFDSSWLDAIGAEAAEEAAGEESTPTEEVEPVEELPEVKYR